MNQELQTQMSYAIEGIRKNVAEACEAVKAAAFQYEELGRTLNRCTDGQVHA